MTRPAVLRAAAWLRATPESAKRPLGAVVADALRSGLYEATPELRLRETDRPRLLDLSPTARVRDGVELPLIRLRSTVPVETSLDPTFDALEVTAALYDAAVASQDACEDPADASARLEEIMTAALALTLTPGMRDLATSSAHYVCGITTSVPWARAQASVFDLRDKGAFTSLMSLPVDPDIAGRIDPTCSIGRPGRTIGGIPIHSIESAYAHMPYDRLPSPVEAMRTLASTDSMQAPHGIARSG